MAEEHHETPRSIALVGLMGSGKSTIGACVASQLAWPMRDSDLDIGVATSRTVAQLAGVEGVDAMHAREVAQALSALTTDEPVVAALAGYAVESPEVRKALRRAFVVWLRASNAVLAQRFSSDDDHRPTFGPDQLAVFAAQMRVRGPLLANVANLVIDVDGETPPQISDRIVRAYRSSEV